MPDLTGLPGWAQLGVGGLVAVIVLVWKRMDDKGHQATIDKMTSDYAADLKAYGARLEGMVGRAFDVIDNNTKGLLALTGAIGEIGMLAKLDARIEQLERDKGDDESPDSRRQR